MTELLTAAQMRAIEKAAIDSGDVTGLEMMERAGAGVVEAIFEEWPELGASAERGPAPSSTGRSDQWRNQGRPPEYLSQNEEVRRAVVLCGPGNNGGDGFVVARLLKERGWDVEVYLYGDPEKLPPDARVNYERWGKLGEVAPWEDCTSERWVHHPLVVEAVFGTGLTRQVPDAIRNVLLAALNCRRVAVDIPGFINSDTGVLLMSWPSGLPGATAAHLTVTFHRQKSGHFLEPGAALCGKVVTKSIGLEVLDRSRADEVVSLVSAPVTLRAGKTAGHHKYSHGHALILSGGPGHTGAARLAARGALRIGAGLVTLGCPPAAQMECAAQLTAIMLRRVGDVPALAKTLEDTRINALCLGPAMGTGEDQAALLKAALESGRGTVLDADALTLLSEHKALFDLLHSNCVLTPHAGEFARLFPDIAEKLNAIPTTGPAYSKVDATREAAARAGCVVLFKGADTVIAEPAGRCSINSAHYDRSAPWLATAGSGDVLAGFITGLLARGFSPMQAAETGAWLHVECARHFGPGLIAEDLPEQLPAVFRALEVT